MHYPMNFVLQKDNIILLFPLIGRSDIFLRKVFHGVIFENMLRKYIFFECRILFINVLMFLKYYNSETTLMRLITQAVSCFDLNELGQLYIDLTILVSSHSHLQGFVTSLVVL